MDWVWVIVIFLTYILSEGDPRKVVIREWIKARPPMLEQVCGLRLRETDFTDDLVAIGLGKFSELSAFGKRLRQS